MYKFITVLLLVLCAGCASKSTSVLLEKKEPPGARPGAHQLQAEEAERLGLKGAMEKIHVMTGLDLLASENFKSLTGKSVGVITNHTGMTSDGRHIVDLLHEAEEVDLVAIFGPEHGVRGVEPDGIAVSSAKDEKTGVPVYSLYGKTRKPTPEMLAGIDVLVFDIQDIGARFYTYIYTMALAMEAASANSVGFIVLDMPNPISGSIIEGPMLREGYESFVGMFPIPVRHGMTVGELARMFVGEGWLEGADSLDLEVVAMSGWKREAWMDETTVPWIAPSPSMRTLSTATVYTGTCFFEGTNISEGRGTDLPFELIGAPWVDSQAIGAELNSLQLPGVSFEPVEFTPVAIPPSVPNPKFKDVLCGGVRVRVNRREIFEPVRTGVEMVAAFKRLYPENFSWRATIDRLYGSAALREGLDAGIPTSSIEEDMQEGLDEFESLRGKYLLYD